MNFDATFWVALSFIFLGVLFYFKVLQKIFGATLDESINKIKKDIDEAEKLKEEAKKFLVNTKLN